MQSIIILGVQILYNNDIVRIINSYQVHSAELMEAILEDFKERVDYKSKRNINSWLKEWKAHNRLYKLGLFKSHTKDCDFEENEAWWRLLIYEIIGG